MIPPMTEPDATFIEMAADVKRAVDVPVIAVGRLGDPATATEAVTSGKADFVALGRTLLADPQWVESCAQRADPALPCLQHLRRRNAKRRRHRLRGERRRPDARRCSRTPSRRSASASP